MTRTATMLIACIATATMADSGLVRLSELAGPWRVTVLTDPTPLRPGPVDFSVLIQDPDTNKAVLDAAITIELHQLEAGVTMRVPATTESSDMGLLHAANFVLPEMGQWSAVVAVDRQGVQVRVPLQFTAAAPPPPWMDLWPWLLPAPVALGLYAANRRLVATHT